MPSSADVCLDGLLPEASWSGAEEGFAEEGFDEEGFDEEGLIVAKKAANSGVRATNSLSDFLKADLSMDQSVGQIGSDTDPDLVRVSRDEEGSED